MTVLKRYLFQILFVTGLVLILIGLPFFVSIQVLFGFALMVVGIILICISFIGGIILKSRRKKEIKFNDVIL